MRKKLLLALMVSLTVLAGIAQVTTSSITGLIKGEKDAPLEGASILAVHVPSGSRYTTSTNARGVFTLTNVRVGGPYTITVTFTGYQTKVENEVYAPLGNVTTVDLNLSSKAEELTNVVVTGTRNPILNSKATGASATLGRVAIDRAPTVGRTINDITKYNAYSNGRSFGGQDSRLNNFTIDGAVFNNGFGLGGQSQAGGRTGSSAISLDAVEELQINIAPFDVRQSGFAGAAINAVTRSGTNSFAGSVFHFWNNRDLAGKKTYGVKVPTTPFEVKTYGFRFGGPIIKNKLFFFVNGESTNSTRPALDWVANRSGATGSVSRTTAADLEDLKSFMQQNFNWDMGAIDNFNNESFSKKFLARVDYNINDKHKLNLRYSFHDSESDVIISNSSSGNTAGNGNRTNSGLALSGQNTGYKVMDNTRSFVAELNSRFTAKFSNQLLVTYSKQIEDRKYRTSLFPTIDILKDGSTYTSLGFDPFTPNNRLDYGTFNFTNNMSFLLGKHTLTYGLSFESFKSNNLFFYGSNGVWTFNSIDDFKAAALAYKANPDLTTSTIVANRFNYRYTLLGNGELPWQVFKGRTYSTYLQDEYRVNNKLKLTLGARLDYVAIPNTAQDYANPYVAGLNFVDPANGGLYKINTGEMPKNRLYFSPRFGFNYDVHGNRTTQIRGGTGVFLSRMPYVLISNQLGNNGVNIGLINVTGDQTKNYPFTLDPSRYTPSTTDVNSLRGYNINYGDPNLRFPQVWKSNIAVDQRLIWGFVGTLEFIYNKNLNALNYVDVNMRKSNANLRGADNRAIFPALDMSGSNATNNRFYNPGIGNAFALTNNNIGDARSITVKVEKPLTRRWGMMLAYTNAVAKDAAFVASTVNANVPGIYGVNDLRAAYSDNDLRHRYVGFLSYRLAYGKGVMGATTFTLGGVSTSGYKISYTYSNDANGDGQINDLMYVHYKGTDMIFRDIVDSRGNITFTAAQQSDAYTKFVSNSSYLKEMKGKYVGRNAVESPWFTRFDLSVEQDLTLKLGKAKTPNTFKLRADIINFSNLLNDHWGMGYVPTTSQPLTYAGRNAAGFPMYRLATPGGSLVDSPWRRSTTIDDVYQIQIGIRYIFNN